MSSLRPASPPQPRATTIRTLKVVITILSAVVVLFLANTARSGSDESSTSLSTQSILSLPVNQAAVATTPPLIPTTAPLLVPTPSPAPSSTAVPPLPAAAVPTPTEETAAAASTAQTLSLSAQAPPANESPAEPAPAAPPEPQAAQPQAAQPQAAQPQAAPAQAAPAQAAAAQSEPTAAPIPTEAPAVETPTPEPTATPLPVVEVPTATPEPTPEPTPTPTPEPVNIYDLELYVLGEINQVRANAGLPPLTLDDRISLISRDWSTQMATGGFFEHRPGSQLDVMMPAQWLRWGENIASAPDIKYAQDSLEASPGHYENMVGDYTHVGIGVYSTGRQVWVTQNFGKY